jgi:ATP-dependent Lon protease
MLTDRVDVPSEVRDQMQFHIVGSVDQVLMLALEPTELAMAA